jgi:hypothetical protein
MMDVIGAAFAKMGVPTFWLLTQPAGTSPAYNGNAWANRAAIHDLADTRENAALVCANYGYSLCDGAHLSPQSKVLIGELVGMQAAMIDNGQFTSHIRPESIQADAKYIEIVFRGAPHLEIDCDRFPAPSARLGFRVTGQPLGFVCDAKVIGQGRLRLECADTLPPKFTLNYAYATRSANDPVEDTSFPFGRGCLREKWLGASLVLPGEQLLKWIPAFSIDIVR